MAAKFKTPGIYIEEINSFPNSVVDVPTAIPAFIGYTEKANKDGKSLLNKPCKIKSFAEYERYFGGAFNSKFDLLDPEPNDYRPIISINGRNYVVDYTKNNKAFMHSSIKFFYDNGGRSCYIVSVGTYRNKTEVKIDKDELLGTTTGGGLNALLKIPEVTMVVLPDAVSLGEACYDVYTAVLNHCGTTQSRMAILDIHNGYKDRTAGYGGDDIITNFRTRIGTQNLSYAAAYYPWLHTKIVVKNSVTFKHINIELKELSNLLNEVSTSTVIDTYLKFKKTNSKDEQKLHAKLLSESFSYNLIIEAMHKMLNLLPPSSAMAGIFTEVDRNRGVWKAPANISVASVDTPAVDISNNDQENLNVDPVSGKSINAIRKFSGRGILVWGGRTLDGNSQEFRYISIRRTIIMLEQSIKSALKAYVFEPNDANTWTAVKNMINNYLTEKWRQGAFAGSQPKDAFGVKVGLGGTMTNNDILNGKLLVSVFIAPVRPAEFIVMSFEQQIKKP